MAYSEAKPAPGAEKREDDEVQTYVQWVEDSEQATQEERGLSERDRDYYDNKQLTAEEQAALKKRKQPVIIVNRIKRKIDFLRGVEAQQRTDPKAFPRNPQDEDAAHAATDALRYVAESNNLDAVRSDVWENLLIEGVGGAEVVVEPDEAGGYEIVVRQVAWDRFFRDPHSSKPDFSDARYLGFIVWMDLEDALLQWPDGKDALEATITEAGSLLGQTYDDKPRFQVWADPKRRRVRIVQIWCKKGREWHHCTFTKGGKLEGGPSPYRDEKGRSECPLVMQSAYVDRDNARYGVVREMIGPQDEINKRRSKALHLLSTRQTFGTKAAVTDVDAAKKELARPDGHLEIAHGKFNEDFGVLPTGDMAAGQFQLLQEAKAEIDLMGPNAAMQGKSSAEQSGRAIIAQQQGGYIELGPMMDRLRQWNIAVYRAIWNRVKQFWTEERWVRVTDDERNIRFVGLNRPITAGDAYLREIEAAEGPEAAAAARREIAGDPRAQQIIGVENSVAEMMVDIIVDDAPDSVTIQHEQFQQIVELAKSGVPLPPDVLIEASQLRNKDQLIEKLQKTAEAGQQPDPALQLEQLRAENKTKEIELTTAAKREETERETVLGRERHALEMEKLGAQRAHFAEQREAARQDREAERATVLADRDFERKQKAAERLGIAPDDLIEEEKVKELAEALTQQTAALGQLVGAIVQTGQEQVAATKELTRVMAAPRRVVRGADGRAEMAQPVL